MSILAGKLRDGNVVRINDRLFKVRKIERVRQGKGGAFVQVTMYNISNHQKIQKLWRVEEKVETVDVFVRKGMYLYKEGDIYYFLLDDAQQIACNKKNIDHVGYLQDGMDVQIHLLQNEHVLHVELPTTITGRVVEVMSNGKVKIGEYEVQVKKCPSYIKTGDEIKFQLETLEFLERV